MNYKQIDHTADLGLEFFGRTRKELFVSAGSGLFDSIVDLGQINSVDTFNINITGFDIEDLLIEWLRELLSLHHIKGFLLKEFQINELTEKRLSGSVSGEAFDEDRHYLKREIKAATYHDLLVERSGHGWKARVIFDV